MSKTCKSCNHTNSDFAHYCTQCGKPLETEDQLIYEKGRYVFKKEEKKYIVVAETEYKQNERKLQSLQSENDTLKSENKTLKNNWWYKFSNWVKKIDWSNVLLLLGVIVVYSLIFILADIIYNSCSNNKEPLEIMKDNESNKYGIFNNKTDKWATVASFDTIFSIKNANSNYYLLVKNNKYGVADSSGQLTVDCTLDSLSKFQYNGLRIIYSNTKQGMIDNGSGRQILPCKYYRVLWWNEPRYNNFGSAGTYVGNIIPVLDSNGVNTWKLYNRQGERIDNYYYSDVAQTGNPDYIKVRRYVKCPKNMYSNSKVVNLCPSEWGLLNSSGQVVMPFEYYTISLISEGYFWVERSYREPYECFSINGKKLFTLPNNMTPDLFREGLAPVHYNGNIGYYDTNGRMVIPFKYQ